MAATLSFDRVAACVELTLNPRAAVPAAAIAQGVMTMMLRHQLAVTAVALTLVGVGVTGTGVALMPQPGGNGPPVPAAAAKKDAPAVAAAAALRKDDPAAAKADADSIRVLRLQETVWRLSEQIDSVEEAVAALERKNPPISDAVLKAKSALLIEVESQLFRTEVMVQESQMKSAETTRQLTALDRKSLTESEIAAAMARIELGDGGDVLRRQLERAETAVQQEQATLTPNAKSPRLEALEKVRKELEAQYQAVVTARRPKAIERLFGEADRRLKSEQKKQAAELAGLTQSVSIYKEKRHALAREITEGTLPRLPSRESEQLRRLKAARDVVESQLLHATYGDAKPPATTSDAKLDRVLSELVELRGEVKRLRDGK